MSNLIEQLGLDEETLKWYQLAACSNMDINLFYDTYESDKIAASQVDQVCLHCPVIRECYNEGIENSERGVWGGVYLNIGKIDDDHNSHKTREDWKRLESIHGTINLYS